MQYEVIAVRRVWLNAEAYKKAFDSSITLVAGKDYFDQPLYRAVNPKRRALRETIQRLGLTGGRQKRKLRKMLNKQEGL